MTDNTTINANPARASMPFKAAMLPLDIVWADKDANLKAVAKALEGLEPSTDLVVLPELFSTGFLPEGEILSAIAESNGGNTMAEIRRLAEMHRTAIAGSFLARTAGHLYNRAFFVEPGGDEIFYDKRHLFSIGSEHDYFTAGNDIRPVIRYRGLNITIAVCYDLRFPVWCRNADVSYDVLVIPANWSRSRHYPWQQLIKARAIENQAYVIGANRSGADRFGDYNGLTMVADYKGVEMKLREDYGSALLYVDLDRNGLESWRRDFPAWRDADRFTIDM